MDVPPGWVSPALGGQGDPFAHPAAGSASGRRRALTRHRWSSSCCAPTTRRARDAGPEPGRDPGQGGLLDRLAELPDPRKRRGVRHRVASILAVASCAVLSGARSCTAIGEFAADLGQDALARLGGRYHPARRCYIAPHEATIRRALHAVDADRLDRVVGGWLAEQVTAGRIRRSRSRSTARPSAAPETATATSCTCWRRSSAIKASWSPSEACPRRPTRSAGSARCWPTWT